MNDKIKTPKSIPLLLAVDFGSSGPTIKVSILLLMFHSNICGKLSIVRCDKYVFLIVLKESVYLDIKFVGSY